MAGSLAIALFGLAGSLAACNPTATEPQTPQPFVFRSLNLRQQDAEGRPLWELTSPETRYDLSRRVAQARDLRGVLYSGGEPLYRFTAANGVVLNDGELVQLEGPTQLQRLDSGDTEPVLITALRVRWYPSREVMELDRRPVALQNDLQLTSERALFRIALDRLELRGQPTLRRLGEQPMVLSVSGVDWLPGSGDVRAQGPVRGEQSQQGRAPRRLEAPSFTGNSRRQTIDLPSVTVHDPDREGTLIARATRIDLTAQELFSKEPFESRLGEATLQGDGFILNLKTSTAVVTSGCRLRQPGDQLTARRCRWNWDTGEVQADGDVVLRRERNEQTTSSERLTGQVASNGFVQFGGSGGRVTTRLRLPEPPASGTPDPEEDQDRSPPFRL